MAKQASSSDIASRVRAALKANPYPVAKPREQSAEDVIGQAVVKGAQSLGHLAIGASPADIRRMVQELCVKHNYNPIEALIRLSKDSSVDTKDQITIHRELAQYVAPKLRAVDISGEVDLSLRVVVRKFIGGDKASVKTIDIPADEVQEGS